MDEDNLFMSEDDLGLIELSSVKQLTAADTILDNIKIRTNQLVGYNYAAERKFKLSVLEWLTNGEPKLFRSPAEGNYVVRLMNTSLSPNDTLGRMLHTFSSTGYEIMDNTIDNLKNYGSKDWYDWCVKNWGTKWNACGTEFDESNPTQIKFDTAWSDVRMRSGRTRLNSSHAT